MNQQRANHEIIAELGRRLRSYRLQMNLSQDQMAAQSGLARNTIINAEAGADPQLSTVVSMLRVLGRLDALEQLLPKPLISPLQLMKMRGNERKRAGKPRLG